MKYFTTLNKIRSHNPCASGWQKMLTTLGKTSADDEPLSLGDILKSNGLDDAIWALRAVDGVDCDARLFACDCAQAVAHLSTDARVQNAIDVARRFIVGEATSGQLDDAADAARAAAAAAWDAADAARAAAAAARAAAAAAWDAAAAAAAADAVDAAAAAAAADAVDAAWDAADAARAAAAAAWDAADAARAAAAAARDAADAADAARDAARATQTKLFVQYFVE